MRSWTRATRQMVADFWRLRLCSGRIQHPAQAAAAHRSRVWGEAAAVRLCSLARIRFSDALSKTMRRWLRLFSLELSTRVPRVKRKKNSVRAEVCSRPKCSALRVGRKQACGDGRGLPGSIKFAPNRRERGWDGVFFFLHRRMGKSRCHFSNVLAFPETIMQFIH